MKKLKVELENCYGIRSLNTELDFTKRKACIVYAPNGVMKTSFAQTFKDLSDGVESKDRIFKSRESKRVVADEAGAEVPAEQVFVIQPYVPEYESARISTLLVNKDLKAEYDAILTVIDEKKELLVKELKKLSGLKSGIDDIVSEVFTKQKGHFLPALVRVEAEVRDEPSSDLSKIVYSQIFNDKVEDFLKTKDFKSKLEGYTKVYDKLLSSSTFFKKGVFNHYQAGEVSKNLKAHGFFKADHSVYLNTKESKKEISTEAELEEVINSEKEAILTDTELAKAFNEIDAKLTNQDLRTFREYILNNQVILPELSNLELFKEKLWKSYFVELKDLYLSLLEEYNKGKARIQEITDTASQQATEWQEVINIFNRRFSVPFVVGIENKQDVILKRVTPNIKFEFVEGDGSRESVEKSDLIDVLSNGERRALYILNIIFEVQARRSAGIKTLFVVDDIADSFDYKNKYAIVEYLQDMLGQGDFYQIILTHNYDFYRTVSGRLELNGSRFHTIKTANSVSLEEDKNYRDIFEKWKSNAHNPDRTDMLLAMIPFVRNLSEYCGFEPQEMKLTSLLHIKQDTDFITIGDLQDIYRSILQDKHDLELQNKASIVKDVIFAEADSILKDPAVHVELEKKIVLSIAIRLKAEEYLIKKINKPDFVSGLKSNQTGKLIREYKKTFSNDTREKDALKIVEQVNLMTPENIHLNSFMYEPILDLSNDHLKRLYTDISAIA